MRIKDLKKEKLRGNTTRFSGANPYTKDGVPLKIVRYKMNVLKKEMKKKGLKFNENI